MLDTLTADAPATEKPEHVRPRTHPHVASVERELREVRAEIKTLEAKRQKAQTERRRIENEQREAREEEDYERLSRLTIEEDEIRSLGEGERETLLNLHGRAMELQERRDAAHVAVVPEIETAVEEWADPKLQALANACQLVLDLSGELMPTFKNVRDGNLHARRFEEGDVPTVNPSVPLFYMPNMLGSRGHVQNLLRKLRQAGYEPETP